MRYAWLLIFFFGLASCADLGSARDIPAQYKSQIVALRSQNIDIGKKCQDLQKQMAELQAQQNWNVQRMNTVAGEGLVSLGLSGEDYAVNLDSMKIIRKKH